MRLEGMPGNYPEKDIGLHGGMGINGIEKPMAPENREISNYEMLFTGNLDEIIRQIEAVKEESKRIPVSYKIEKVEENGDIGSVTVTFRENHHINHSDLADWGFNHDEYDPKKAS